MTATNRWTGLGLLAAGLLCLGFAFRDALAQMVGIWMTREEYSHGLLIPGVAAWLAWRQRARLAGVPIRGSWAGVALLLAGCLLAIAGEIATIYTVVQYGLLAAFYGAVLAAIGPRAFREIAVPLAVLVFMIPLPNFLLNNFSAEMQLLSSRLGVFFLRVAGVSVYLEGNVIDLGIYQLQVAEACDGLRYLFPLMTLGFIMAYVFRAAMWKRVLLFLSSIPITIVMNSLRVALIGISVEHWGIGMAEGLLHDFQGWLVFMMSAALMLVVVAVLARIGRDRGPWRELFQFDEPAAPAGPAASTASLPLSRELTAASLSLVAVAVLMVALPARVEAVPPRASFAEFPLRLGEFTGRRHPLEEVYLDVLQLDDYLLADYRLDSRSLPVNLYVTWYGSQRKGQSVHSPRSCIPGGGWQIRSLESLELADIDVGGRPLRVNRVIIEHGAQRQVVYYWFQQRGRVVTNEYLVKWFIFWDALTRNRSDGAMIRLTAPVPEGTDVEEADRLLRQLAAQAAPLLPDFVPG